MSKKGLRKLVFTTPYFVDSLRLQLTLSVQEPHHELYALCLGPPAFREPMKPLDLGELLSHATRDEVTKVTKGD